MMDLFHQTAAARRAEEDRCRVELAKRQALAPLRPAVRQEPCDVGLFSHAAQQSDLVERCK